MCGKVSVSAVALGLLGALTLQIAVAAEVPPRQITVSAMAQVEAVPDQVVLTVGIRTEDAKSLLTAKAENDRRTSALLGLAPKYRLPDKQVQVSSLSMGPVFEDRRSGEKRRLLGYYVNRQFEITLKDFKVLEMILSDALEAGVTDVDDVLFQTTKHREHQVDARRRAVEYAKEKAGHLAELNGLRLGKAIRIEEGVEGSRHTTGFGGAMASKDVTANSDADRPGQARVRFVNQGARAQQDVDTPKGASTPKQTIPPGVLVIEATVTIIFEMLDRS